MSEFEYILNFAQNHERADACLPGTTTTSIRVAVCRRIHGPAPPVSSTHSCSFVQSTTRIESSPQVFLLRLHRPGQCGSGQYDCAGTVALSRRGAVTPPLAGRTPQRAGRQDRAPPPAPGCSAGSRRSASRQDPPPPMPGSSGIRAMRGGRSLSIVSSPRSRLTTRKILSRERPSDSARSRMRPAVRIPRPPRDRSRSGGPSGSGSSPPGRYAPSRPRNPRRRAGNHAQASRCTR